MSNKTCSTCAIWRAPPGIDTGKIPRAVGTCAIGGPAPDHGCSDTAASESCPKHRAATDTT